MNKTGTGNFNYFMIYLFYWISDTCLYPYLGIFYEQRGFSGTQIGYASGIMCFAAVCAALITGFFGDRFGKLKHLVFVLFLGVIVSTFLLQINAGVAFLMFAIFIYGFCTYPISDLVDKMLIDRLGGEVHKYARYRMGGTIGAAIGVVIAGYIINKADVSVLFQVFWLLIIPGLIFLAMAPCSTHSLAISKISDYGLIVKNKMFIPIYLTMIIWGFTESSVLQFQTLHIKSAGLPSYYTSVFIASAMLGEIIAFMLAPKLLLKLSESSLLAIAFILEFLKVSSLAFVGRLPLGVVVFFQFSGGGAYSFLISTITMLIAKNYPSQISCTAHNLKTIASSGVGVTCGSMLIGYMYQYYTSKIAYVIMASVALIFSVFVSTISVVKRKKANLDKTEEIDLRV